MPNKKDTSTHESLQVRKVIPAPPDRVFAAWTNPDELEKWWGPKDVRCLSAEIDLRVGGQYRIENELPDDTVLWIVGEFETIERPHLLIYTWTVDSASHSTERVSVRFDRHEQGTEVVIIHDLIPTTILRDQHQQGWTGCLDGLGDYLAEASRCQLN